MTRLKARADPAAAPPPLAAHTRRAYAADWHAFAGWCITAPAVPLPAAPETVARYLASLGTGFSPSTIRRKLSAIGDQHRRAGLPWDTRHPAIGAAFQGLLAAAPAAQRPAAALGRSEIQKLLASCGSDLAGMRDRALLLLAWTVGVRRGQLVGFDREDVVFTPAGMTLQVAGTERLVARSEDPAVCPVRAIEAWLRRTDIGYGAIFRRVTATDTLEDRLTPQGVWRILRRRVALAKLVVPPGLRLSPDGLRSTATIAPPAKQARKAKLTPKAKQAANAKRSTRVRGR